MTPSHPTQMDQHSGHTPTPWGYIVSKSLIHIETDVQATGVDMPVCSIPKSREADAALIVRAVNSHAALLASHQRLAEALTAMSAHYGGSLDYQPAYVAMGRAALASIPKETT